MTLPMELPNVLTPCLIVANGEGTLECCYADGVRLMTTLGNRGVAATLMLAEIPAAPAKDSGFLAQTLAERRYFADAD